MVYKCEKCAHTTLKAYSSSDGTYKCLCSACHAGYEKEFGNKDDAEIVRDAEARINKRIKAVVESLSAIKNRLKEHEDKNGDLERRLENLEKEVSKICSEMESLAADNIRKIKEAIKGQLKNDNAKNSR